MKITEIRPFFLKPSVLVRVKTDAGIMGWGECSPMNGPVILAHINHCLAPLVIGRDPFDLEAIVEAMFLQGYKLAGQCQAMAVSGIEIALWDICGKALQMPIYKLLGGAYRTKIGVYASSMRRDSTPQQEVDRLARLVEEQGFRGVKVKIGQRQGFDSDASPGRSEALVCALRQRLGDDIAIMVDANSAFSAPRAIEMGRRLEQYRIFHYEEPVPYRDLDALAKVAQALDVPVAGGEQEWDPLRFKEMLLKGAADIVQPDIVKVGGFLISKRIAALAEAFGAVVTPHQTQPLGTIANLHLAACTPCLRYLQEVNIEPHRYGARLFRNPVPVVDGTMTVPDGPGLGVEINEELLAGAE